MSRPLARVLRRVALTCAAALVLLLAFIKIRYGGGAPYPDVSTPPVLGPAALQAVVTMDFPLGNVTSSKDGRVFFNLHPFAQPHRFTPATLFELVDGAPRPYPDGAAQAELRFVFGMTVAAGRLWLTAPATLERSRTRLFAFDLATNRKVLDRELPPGVGRFAQDLRVSPDGATIYLADTGALRLTRAALLVLDVATWTARTVLYDDPSTQAQDLIIQTRNGPHRIGYGLISFQVGVDGVALSPDGAWLYYGTMCHDSLYRVRTADLRDASLAPAALASRVERVGRKPLSDGIEVTPDGSVLITDIEHGAVARLAPDGQLQTLVRDPQIVWSDGVTVTPGGEVLFTDSGIPSYIDQLLRPPSRERLAAGRPYRLYRFRLPGSGGPR